MKVCTMAKIDPRLAAALDHAQQGESVQAVVTLRSHGPKRPLGPEETDRSVQALLQRACEKTRHQPHDVVVFSHMQSFMVDADPDFIREILNEERIDVAALNKG